MACPSCDSTDCNKTEQERKEAEVPDVNFKDVVLLCNKCGWGWHCVGTKRINTSSSAL